jgi:hypothetical protein
MAKSQTLVHRGLRHPPMLPISDLFLIVMSILPTDPEGSLIKQPSENLTAQQQKLASALSNKRGKAMAVSLTTARHGSQDALGAQR